MSDDLVEEAHSLRVLAHAIALSKAERQSLCGLKGRADQTEVKTCPCPQRKFDNGAVFARAGGKFGRGRLAVYLVSLLSGLRDCVLLDDVGELGESQLLVDDLLAWVQCLVKNADDLVSLSVGKLIFIARATSLSSRLYSMLDTSKTTDILFLIDVRHSPLRVSHVLPPGMERAVRAVADLLCGLSEGKTALRTVSPEALSETSLVGLSGILLDYICSYIDPEEATVNSNDDWAEPSSPALVGERLCILTGFGRTVVPLNKRFEDDDILLLFGCSFPECLEEQFRSRVDSWTEHLTNSADLSFWNEILVRRTSHGGNTGLIL